MTTGSHRADVFICYRRGTGNQSARYFEAAFRARGIRTHLDVKSFEAGKFDESLLARISETPNFLIILTPGCLDSFEGHQSWFQREIAYALQTRRNIIPVMIGEFDFPDTLPEAIRDLNVVNAIKYDHDYSDEVVARIVPQLHLQRPWQLGRQVTVVQAVTVIVASLLVAYGVISYRRIQQPPTPAVTKPADTMVEPVSQPPPASVKEVIADRERLAQRGTPPPSVASRRPATPSVATVSKVDVAAGPPVKPEGQGRSIGPSVDAVPVRSAENLSLPAQPPPAMPSSPVAQPASLPVAQPASPPKDTALPVHDPEIDRRAIQQILTQYQNAYRARDTEALRQIYNGINEQQLRQLATAREYRLELTDVQISVDGDNATVKCVRRISFLAEKGGRNQTNPSTTIRLRKEPRGWRIVDVQ